ncbi:hypothetical protein GE061_014400 [Apolygus lucorum]|uniref:Uncharacterized protein n=1 Tax=Apolygus lucorum TaxID=248454 RepID=A0A8S9XQQ9_APOLU|nr:hypothetical protein GE061_014400 [Apolygus lucorum]
MSANQEEKDRERIDDDKRIGITLPTSPLAVEDKQSRRDSGVDGKKVAANVTLQTDTLRETSRDIDIIASRRPPRSQSWAC